MQGVDDKEWHAKNGHIKCQTDGVDGQSKCIEVNIIFGCRVPCFRDGVGDVQFNLQNSVKSTGSGRRSYNQDGNDPETGYGDKDPAGEFEPRFKGEEAAIEE